MPAQNKATEPDMARNRIAPFLQWKTALSGILSACSANLTQYIKESIRPEAKPVGPKRSRLVYVSVRAIRAAGVVHIFENQQSSAIF